MTADTPDSDGMRNGTETTADSTATTSIQRRTLLACLGLGALGAVPHTIGASSTMAGIHGIHGSVGQTDDPEKSPEERLRNATFHPSQPLFDHDEETSQVVSDGPFAHVTKNLEVAGHGARLLPNGTTDVQALDRYAYVGTWHVPCGTGEGFGEDELVDDQLGPGVAVFDVRNPNRLTYVGSLPSVEGSMINDVKVKRMNAGTILGHTNEPCIGAAAPGRGGIELYDIEDPTQPTHLASVQVDDANPVLRDVFGFVDVGVHNLRLFTQDDRDYVAVAAPHTIFGQLQIFEITDPTEPEFVSAWGAEFLCEGEFCSDDPHTETDIGVILDVHFEWMLDGFGEFRRRFLHDVSISEDGTRAYLANWDAGVILLDITDPADPQFISKALDPTAGDGEVNSHTAWPSEDGSVVIETEEDFSIFQLAFGITEGPHAGTYEATEGFFTTPIVDLPDRTMAGPTTYLGFACDPDGIPEAEQDGEIAVIQRGPLEDPCAFDRKAEIAIEAGYDGMVVFNHPSDESTTIMSGDPRDIPGVFVGHSTGLAIFDVEDVTALSVGDTGASIEAISEPAQWGQVRIWDFSDEEHPVLASEFDTRCSFDPFHEDCDPRGTYSVHNAIIERGKAYISWYSDGVLILDISDPYTPVETARWSPAGEEFEEENGGILDIWGVWKESRKPWIYAADRNGGLYVLKEYGSGTEQRGG